MEREKKTEKLLEKKRLTEKLFERKRDRLRNCLREKETD